MTDIVERLRASQGPWSMQAADEIERLRAALVLFIQTVNPPYPQSMALWQQHLKTATENAKAALIAAAQVGGLTIEQSVDVAERFWKAEKAATIERCAQVAEWFSNVEKFTAEDVAARIRALKDKP